MASLALPCSIQLTASRSAHRIRIKPTNKKYLIKSYGYRIFASFRAGFAMKQAMSAERFKRRKFVAALGSTALVNAVGPVVAAAAVPGKLDARDVDLSAGFSRAKFEALLNHTFFIETSDHGNVMVRLIAVQTKRITKPQPTAVDQFCVMFRGLLLPALPSGVYEVSHLSAGRFHLHLQALPPQRSQPLYRADFSLV